MTTGWYKKKKKKTIKYTCEKAVEMCKKALEEFPEEKVERFEAGTSGIGMATFYEYKKVKKFKGY